MDLLVKGTAHTRMKVIGAKITVKTSATSDIGRLTNLLRRRRRIGRKTKRPLESFLVVSQGMHFSYLDGIVG